MHLANVYMKNKPQVMHLPKASASRGIYKKQEIYSGKKCLTTMDIIPGVK